MTDLTAEGAGVGTVPSMLRKLVATLVVVSVGLLVAAGPASAATGPQTFRLVFTGDPAPGLVGKAVATGLVNAIGTDTAVDQPTGADVITLPKGSITFIATAPPGGITFNPATCVVRFNVVGGSYLVVGGTGAYQGASGSGTYAAKGVEVFNRLNGACDTTSVRSFVLSFVLTGPLTIP